MSKKAFLLAVFALGCYHAAFAQQRITESLQYWTLGLRVPEILTGTRAGYYGEYHYLPVGTSPYYYEVQTEGEGTVEFWVYDPFKCKINPDPGYGSYGMAWGLQNPLYRVMAVGNFRNPFVAGCLGYSPWSDVAPYSPGWFKDGIRGANSAPWKAGWYKWMVDGRYENITFTIHCITNGPPDDDTITGDCSQTYDATSNGGIWAAMFCCGWKAMWLRGDNASGIEDPYVDVTGGTGVFTEFGGGPIGVAKSYRQTSWGNIKSLYK
jgi:hypothetical protein